MANKEKQAIYKVTAQGRVEHEKLEVGTLCCANPDKFEAWELDYNQQAKDEETGGFIQFVSSLNKKPLKIYRNIPQSESHTTRQIAMQQFDEQLTTLLEKSSKNSMLLWLGIILVLLLLIIGLVVLSNMNG